MGAKIDVWQANDEGFYDVQQKGIQPDFNLRGVFRSDAEGRYGFRGVKPKSHPIPGDGTVGKLHAALGPHPNRPGHLHYIIGADGFEILTTHILFAEAGFDGPILEASTTSSSRAPQRRLHAGRGKGGLSTMRWAEAP